MAHIKYNVTYTHSEQYLHMGSALQIFSFIFLFFSWRGNTTDVSVPKSKSFAIVVSLGTSLASRRPLRKSNRSLFLLSPRPTYGHRCRPLVFCHREGCHSAPPHLPVSAGAGAVPGLRPPSRLWHGDPWLPARSRRAWRLRAGGLRPRRR